MTTSEVNSECITVLVIEDNPGDTRLIREMFSVVGGGSFKLECTDQLSAGLKRLAQGGIDLVLLDLSLPDSQGLDTFIRTHEAAPDVPIVLLTGLDDASLGFTALREGAQDYIVKWQLNSDMLVRLTRYAVERHRLQKELKQALEQQEQEHLRNIINTTTDAMVIVDSTDIVRFVNPAAEALLGHKTEELVGEPFGFPIEIGETTELDITRRNGKVAVAEMRTVEIEWEGQSARLASLRDITERKQTEEKRLTMEQQLQLAGRLSVVGEMAAGIAHELNNPLTAIQMYAQILNGRKDLDKTIRGDVETIFHEAQRATKITSNLLSFARMYTPEKQPIAINEVVVSILELHTYRMRVNNIDIVIELDANLPSTMADFHQMQQVFANIITNAEQVMTEANQGGQLTIKTRKVGEMIEISFADTGPGIPDENLKRIFDPFFTTKEVGKGTGLGLSICHGIVEDHQGYIYARNNPDGGATFVVELPVIPDNS
jgi:two-component system cell cycle sensor histidine kinase/response regulator CckA